jgi:hypothetical protein
MGVDVPSTVFTREDNTKYKQKIRRCLDVFAMMLDDFGFDSDRPMTGLEVEIHLIDLDANPAMRNQQILDALNDPAFQTELGKFNLELNAPPRLIAGDGFADYERDLSARLSRASEHARKLDTSLVLIGINPSLTEAHAVLANISDNERYSQLNDQIFLHRGENMPLDISGTERLQTVTDSIMPEAAGTSIQFHIQVAPEDFANYWNASQAIAGAQILVGSNSPYIFGRQVWHESRIAVFSQATDTRPDELKNQGVRPRVWFGERWITSIFDLFEENVRYFPPLLPIVSDEDPVEVLRSGGVPVMNELRLHNGTVYRWNRPVYDIMNGRPHLRVENRVVPAGPTVVDMLANAAFYFGLTTELAHADRPIWTQLPFTAAELNFFGACRDGIEAPQFWPRLGELPGPTLVLDVLLPKAYAGLDRFDVAPALRDRLLGIIEQRCRTKRTGATWQIAWVNELERGGLSRSAALREMLHRYVANAEHGEPVHVWDYPASA